MFIMAACTTMSDDLSHTPTASQQDNLVQEVGIQIEPYEALNTLLDSFGKSTRSDMSNYPDWFGGAYIDDNKLIILSTNLSKSITTTKDILATVIEAKYSLNILDSLVAEVRNKIDLIPIDIASNLSGCGVDIKSNNVLVMLKDISEDKINQFKHNIIDHDALVFIQSSGWELYNHAVYQLPHL